MLADSGFVGIDTRRSGGWMREGERLRRRLGEGDDPGADDRVATEKHCVRKEIPS